jgi:hypothetical protein
LFAARRFAFEEEAQAAGRRSAVLRSHPVEPDHGVQGPGQAEHLADFYPDLRDERMTSSIGICHQRFSTNTLPRWNRAAVPLPGPQRRDQQRQR